MGDRDLQHLQQLVAGLQQRVDDLEARLADLAEAAHPGAPVAAAGAGAVTLGAVAADDTDLRPLAVRAFFLLGRSVLVLAGGFLLRALAGAGVLPGPFAFGAGVAYVLAILFACDRAARRGDGAGAGALGVTAVFVAYPFLGEAAARLHLVSPVAAAAGWAAVTAAGLATAARARLRLVAWAFTLGALGSGVLLQAATGRPLLFTWLLLGLGAGTLLLAYGRGWRAKRWVVALAVDALMLRLVIQASGGAEGAPAPDAVLPLALALPVTYLGLFTYRALVLGKGVRAFYISQSLAVLAIGYGGALGLARADGSGSVALGLGALAAAIAYYAVSFAVVRRRHGQGRAFVWCASLALVFLALGSRVVAGGPWLPWCWMVLGLGATLEGNRTGRLTLHAHGAVYLMLGVMSSGLGSAAWHAFVGGAAGPWPGPGAAGLATWLVAATCWVLQARSGLAAAVAGIARLPRFGAALPVLLGAGWAAVVALAKAAGDGPAALAVTRTAVLSATVVALAFASRRSRWPELGWPVVPLLVLGAVKLLIEDTRRGSPVTLTLALAFFGAALIVAPRVLLAARRGAAGAADAARVAAGDSGDGN